MKKLLLMGALLSLMSGCIIFMGLLDDSFEDDDVKTDARVIDTTGVKQEHSIGDYGEDVDWVKFLAENTRTYQIAALSTSDDMDIEFELYDESDNLLYLATGSNNPEAYTFDCTNDGIYYLKIYESGQNDFGYYGLTVTRL